MDVGPIGGPRRQVKRAGFDTKRDAEAALYDLKSKRGTLPTRSGLTVGEFADEWIARLERSGRKGKRLAPSTLDSYRGYLTRHIRPYIGDLPIQKVTDRDVDGAWGLYDRLAADGRSVTTIRFVHLILGMLFRAAVKRKVLAASPMAGIDPPAPDEDGDEVGTTWTADELTRFIRFVESDDLAALWRVAATTGLRRGELLGLRWSDVDFERRDDEGRVRPELAVRQQYTPSRFRAPKSSRSARVVPLGAGTAAALHRHRRDQLENRVASGNRDGLDLVFTRADGNPIRPTWLSDRFRQVVRASGLRVIRLHDLRHTVASLWLADGEPVTVVSARLGHESPAITLDVYAQYVPDKAQAAAADRFDAMLDG